MDLDILTDKVGLFFSNVYFHSAIFITRKCVYRFISTCSNYGLVTKQVAAVANSMEEGSAPLDSATLRESKIARFKGEKALKASLLELQQKQMQHLRRRQVKAHLWWIVIF